MKYLAENYQKIKDSLPQNVNLVAVSKTHSIEKILTIYNLGQRIFGENKVQELVEKYHQLPKDIQWHIIGHLQRNKVKYIASFIDTIQSVDSEKLLIEIDKQAQKCNRKINVLLQLKIAKEETKFGLSKEETLKIINNYHLGKFPNIQINGLMGMATFTDKKQQIEAEFLELKSFFDEISFQFNLKTLSIGMSDDYPIAIKCGSNSVRIGSAIFGNRNYS